MDELFRLMESLTDEQLERVQKAEKWTMGRYFDWEDTSRRCLVGHAWDHAIDCVVPEGESVDRIAELASPFDNAARIRGADGAGRECSARAAEILATRRAAKEVACTA